MNSAFHIDGYAITSADGMIAGPDGIMPKSLQFEADRQFFIEALNKVDLVVHGRHSHEGQPNSPMRRRFWMTRSVARLELRPGETRQWSWNPEGMPLEDACRAIGMTGGDIGVLGGPSAYTQFLPVYRAFYLCNAERVRIPGGTPVFAEIRDGHSAEQILRDNGLVPEPTLALDAALGVTLTRWVRA
jgi:dihydrofolate reductase